jgi:hypothetical protein
MTTKISIPAKAVLENRSIMFDLVSPSRCSRCDAANAKQFESHPLKYEAGMIGVRQFTRKYRHNIKLRIRLPLCETCYQANFIEDPNTCSLDPNPLGKAARWMSIGIKAGSVVAGLAFILLMKVIPIPSTIPWIQSLWSILIGLALLIYAIVFGVTELTNRKLRLGLNERGYNARLHRAEIYVKMQLEDPQPEDEAVVINMQNDDWAEECAYNHGWIFEKVNSRSENLEAK